MSTKNQVEQHSTTGTVYGRSPKMKESYEHITVHPTKDMICSCNSCGRQNYDPTAKDIVAPSGLNLFDLCISSNGYQIQVIHLCPDCIKDLRSKLFPFSA
jgi:hypothetical protein